MIAYLFDVDGTITDSRAEIKPWMEEALLDLAKDNPVYLITGSDYPKTIEQVGDKVMSVVKMSMNCNCSSLWVNGVNTYNDEWQLTDEMREFLEDELANSGFAFRTGIHIEERPGMVNFSIVGRGSNTAQRKMYVGFDRTVSERESIASRFNQRFPEMEAKVAGEIGLDINPLKADKRRAIDIIGKDYTYYFYGDNTQKGGNDFPLASRIKREGIGKVFTVKKPAHTMKALGYIQGYRELPDG